MAVVVYRVRPVGQEVLPNVPGWGPTSGGQLVEVAGDGFALSPDGVPRVRVSFGTATATAVRVVGTGLLRAVTPPTPVATNYDSTHTLVTDGTGNVDVVVEVLDSAGVPVPGEVGVLSGGYEYRREPVHDDYPGVYLRVIESLVQQLRRDLVPEVSFTTRAVDYVQLAARLPAVVLTGVSFTPSDWRVRGPDVLAGTEQLVGSVSGLLLAEEVDVVDLVFPVEIYVDDAHGGVAGLLNLLGILRRLVKRRPTLDVVAAPLDLGSGVVARHRLSWDGGDVQSIPRDASNDDGLYWATGTLRVYAVEVRGGSYAGTGIADVVSSIVTVEIPTT